MIQVSVVHLSGFVVWCGMNCWVEYFMLCDIFGALSRLVMLRYLQSDKFSFDPSRWRSSQEPGHSSADEASMLLLQLSGTVFLFIYVITVTFIPGTRTQFGRRSCRVAAPAVWNSLPPQLHSPSISRGQFRAGLKTHLFNQAYTSFCFNSELTYLLYCQVDSTVTASRWNTLAVVFCVHLDWLVVCQRSPGKLMKIAEAVFSGHES